MKKVTILIAMVVSVLTTSLSAASFKTQKWQTSNGAKVIFYQANEVPMLDIQIAFAAGSAYDGKAFGLSALTANLLNQGNGNLDTSQVAEKLADTGAQYEAEVNRDMSVLGLRTLTSEAALKQAVDTFSLIINKPTFRQESFNREKNQMLIAITQAQESPDDMANITFFEKLYPNHPYGHPVNGTTNTMKAMQSWQVRNFYKRYYVAANAVIVLVGDISEEQAHQIAEQLTQPMLKGEAAPAVPKASALAAAEKIDVPFPSSQTTIRLGQLGISHKDPNYFPFLVGNYILGGGSLVSRLAVEVREQRGLTYGVVSQFLPMPGDGPFLVSFATQNKQAKDALQVTREILTQFLRNGPSEEELTAAKQYLSGSFPLSLSSNSNIATMLLNITFYQLPDDYLDTYVARIETVSAAEIKEAFAKLIKPETMLLVAVGKM